MPWSGEQRGFVIEAFFKNAECVIATLSAFRTPFSLNPNESVLDRKTNLNWVQNLRVTGSAIQFGVLCPRQAHRGTLFFWRERCYSYCDFQPVLRDVGELFTPKNWRVQKYLYLLVSTGWGHSSYTARCSRAVLQKMFPGCLIYLRENIKLPPRSPDLSPCKYFLWEYLKSKVFKHRPRSIEELRKAIRQEISAIPLIDMLARVMENFRERSHMCVARRGNHLTV